MVREDQSSPAKGDLQMDRQTSFFVLSGLPFLFKDACSVPFHLEAGQLTVAPTNTAECRNLPKVTQLAWWQSGARVTPGCSATSDELPNSFPGTEMPGLPCASTDPPKGVSVPPPPRLGWSPPDHMLTLSGVTCPWYLENTSFSHLPS